MHYIYSWETIQGEVFYIGQGIYQNKVISECSSKYARAYAIHYRLSKKGKRINAYCQDKANLLLNAGEPHVVKILHENLSKDEANEIEIKLISKHGKLIENTGTLCNMTDGGDFNPMYNENIRKLHKEKINSLDRKKIVEKLKETQKSEKFIKNHREKALNNMNNPEYKKEWLKIFKSEMNIIKMRKAQKCKSIVYKGIVYYSISELARCLGISKQCLRHRIKRNLDYATGKC